MSCSLAWAVRLTFKHHRASLKRSSAVALGELCEFVFVGVQDRVKRPFDAFLGESHHADPLVDDVLRLFLG